MASSLIGPFVFGPIGLAQTTRAESLGVPAASGKVLGVIDLIIGTLVALWLLSLAGL